MLKEAMEAIKVTERDGDLTSRYSDILTGFSGNKLIGALQRLSQIFSDEKDVIYLEVGVYQGLTLLSVAGTEGASIPCYGIDNFAKHDPDNINKSLVQERTKKMMLNNVVLIDEDYEDALQNLNDHIGNKKIGLYFIDGPHDYRSQLMCLMLATPYLHENAIIVIDDANYQHVRQANCDFLTTHTEFKLLFEAYTDCHPGNMTSEQIKDAKAGWWDGVNILVRDKSDLLKRTFPPTERNRLLFENDHVVHASEVSELVPDMIRSIQLMSITKPIQSIRSILSIMKKLYSHRRSHKIRFHFMNTYSDNLASSKYAEWNTGSNVSSAT